jgi:pyrimidine dimer DNA glycosylase
MRMWMVPPSLMCRKHLLGEHLEVHMLVGSLRRGRSVQGFLDRGLLEPQHVRSRHKALVAEMRRRGYKHASPLLKVRVKVDGRVDVRRSARELSARCAECKALRRRVRCRR